MSATSALGVIERAGIVPVVEVSDAALAVSLADALAAGGLALAEITFRTEAAAAAIAALAAERPDFLVGAGTLVNAASVAAASRAGARFGVSPGFGADVVDAARAHGLPLTPGVMTPSEVQSALAAGFTVLKFFPAASAGGLATLSALGGPFAFHGARFIPTGGIDEGTAADYLASPLVVAVGGSWIAPAADVAAERWDAITERARRARALVDGVRAAGAAL